MAAKISRTGATATDTSNNDNHAHNGNGGSQPAGTPVQGAPTQGNLGSLNFTVKKVTVPVSRRGAGRKAAELPEEFITAAIKMYNNNPTEDNDEMEGVELVMTNRDIQKYLVAGIKKIQANHMPNAADGVWLKSSVNVLPDSPNKRSNDANDADKLVSLVWTVRKRTQAEVDKILEKASA